MTRRESYYTLPDGCSKYATCKSCPFPDCEASIKDLKKRSTVDDMHLKVLELHSKNVPASMILRRTGFRDIRSVYRIIREG